MNRISLVGRLRTQKLLGRTVLILLAFSLLTVGGSYLFVRGEMVSRYREQGMEGTVTWALDQLVSDRSFVRAGYGLDHPGPGASDPDLLEGR